jgi:polyketide biosynthesis acyl carrier protein
MTEHDIFQTVRNVTLEVLPFLSADDVTIDKSLKDLGANSIDRAEVVTISMEKLGIKIPMLEFGKAKNLRDLVGVLNTFL